MINVSEFRGKEIAFLRKDRKFPKRGYQISNSENYDVLKKMLDTEKDEYNTYVTIDTYENFPRLPFPPKQHWKAWKQWNDNPNKIIKNLDFFLDFDSEPTIEGITKAWKDVQFAKKLLPLFLGEQAKYLTIWFSGNKGFHILGKTKVETIPQENIEKQIKIATELKMVCPTLDITVYNLGRLRKLLGSRVYSPTFGKTRVIPILDEQDFKALIIALETKNTKWFESKQLIRINNINITGVKK
jgi:hypothetical protein